MYHVLRIVNCIVIDAIHIMSTYAVCNVQMDQTSAVCVKIVFSFSPNKIPMVWSARFLGCMMCLDIPVSESDRPLLCGH